MTHTITTNSPEETRALARHSVRTLTGGMILCLQGDLGSGKTTFAQGLLEALGARGPHTSPTFTIIKTYTLSVPHPHGITTVHHIDPYRVEADDLLQLGWHDIIADAHALVIVEWPEKLLRIMPSHARFVRFVFVDDTHRTIELPPNI